MKNLKTDTHSHMEAATFSTMHTVVNWIGMQDAIIEIITHQIP